MNGRDKRKRAAKVKTQSNVSELGRLVENYDGTELPRHFDLWTQGMQIAFLRKHQRREPMRRVDPLLTQADYARLAKK